VRGALRRQRRAVVLLPLEAVRLLLAPRVRLPLRLRGAHLRLLPRLERSELRRSAVLGLLFEARALCRQRLLVLRLALREHRVVLALERHDVAVRRLLPLRALLLGTRACLCRPVRTLLLQLVLHEPGVLLLLGLPTPLELLQLRLRLALPLLLSRAQHRHRLAPVVLLHLRQLLLVLELRRAGCLLALRAVLLQPLPLRRQPVRLLLLRLPPQLLPVRVVRRLLLPRARLLLRQPLVRLELVGAPRVRELLLMVARERLP
jgi:hypothetical protein